MEILFLCRQREDMDRVKDCRVRNLLLPNSRSGPRQCPELTF